MQRLMEQTPLPTLLMRTVIQSLSMYPRLIGFVLNILQRLIVKQVGILCFNFTEAGTVCCLLVDVVFLHYETIWFILHLFHLFEEFKSNFRKIFLSKAFDEDPRCFPFSAFWFQVYFFCWCASRISVMLHGERYVCFSWGVEPEQGMGRVHQVLSANQATVVPSTFTTASSTA